jgi:RNA polymerase sigma factor (TIGR02999 family)
MVSSELDTTQLLARSRAGDAPAREELLPRVYDELRRIAHSRLARHRSGDTLNTTALVHEAYLKLVDSSRAEWQDRTHFVALCARAMRFILVDYARARMAEKRGGGEAPLSLDESRVAAAESAGDVLDLHDALDRLMAADERLGRLVEYRFFGGMTHEEIAEVTGLSVPTVKRDWRRARAWLYHEMRAGTGLAPE